MRLVYLETVRNAVLCDLGGSKFRAEENVNTEPPQATRQVFIRHITTAAGILTFFVAIIGGIFYGFGESWSLSYLHLAALTIALLTAIIYLVWFILTRKDPKYLDVPRVKKVLVEHRLLLVGQSPWLSVDVLTATYVMESDMERLVGIGKVVNVQSNGLVQISVQPHERGYQTDDEIWNALNNVNRELILVRPGFMRGAL